MVKSFLRTIANFCVVAKVAIIQERFGQMWLQAKYESKLFLKRHHYVFLAKYVGIFFLNYVQIMAIENLRRHLIFSSFKFEYKKFGGKKKRKKDDWLGTTVVVKLSVAV